MKRIVLLATLFVLASTTSASAQNFSVSGPGGTIPDYTSYCGPWNTQPDWPILTSDVTVPADVLSITSVTLTGLIHETRSDLQMFLTSPSGTRYNVIVRPGFTNNFCDGDLGGFDSGDYVIVESGAATSSRESPTSKGARTTSTSTRERTGSGPAPRIRSTTTR